MVFSIGPSVRSCAHRRTRRGYAFAELVVIVVVLGTLAAVLIPQFSRASIPSGDESVREQLRTVRAAIELYRAQHHDQLPKLATDWLDLTHATDADGKTEGRPLFGPYLPKPPINPLTGGTRVGEAPDRGIDWWWDASSGTIAAMYDNGTVFTESAP